MKLIDSIRFRIATLFQREQMRDEMEEELRSHIQHRADDLERSGLGRAESERRARIEFGGREKYKEEIHQAAGGHFFETVLQDARYSLRVLRKSPGFTIAAILTLALAIGANAVVFSVMNAFILRPLNVPEPESLYALQHGDAASGYLSYPNYVDLRDHNHSFDDLAAFNLLMVGFDSGENPSSEWGEDVSGNYFDALGLQPYLGHFFHASDEHGVNSAPYIVLSHAFWHTRFQDDRSVVGRVVRLNGHPFTVIGVGPPEFNGTLLFFNPAFFVPMVESLLAGEDLNARGGSSVFESMGHLKPGVTPAQAVADLNSIGVYLEKVYPKDVSKMTFVLRRPNLYGDFLGRPVRAFMAGLMLLTGLILLAACANLGSLFAARAADRSREVALRLALGSTRKRILRGLFTEAIMISLAGGGVGLLGSVVLLRALSAWQPIPSYPIHLAVNPDAKVYVVAVLLALASGILFGAVPVRQVLRTNPYEVVKAGSGSIAGKRMSAREVLLVVQIAICGVLVTSSLVAVRGLVRSLHAHLGFDIENTMLAETDLSTAGYSADRVPAMQKRMVEAVQGLPGVESVGLADALPLSVNGGDDQLVFANQLSDLRPSNAAGKIRTYNVSPEYFQASGTALLSGRLFTGHDDQGSPRVAIVNQEFARKLFGSAANAIGGWYKLKNGTRIQVVGIAQDGKYSTLTEDPVPAMFFPILQSPSTSTILVVRSRPGSDRNPQPIGAAMRTALQRLDAGLPVTIEARDKLLDSTLFGPRMATISLGVLGLMGAMLSITGVFGMAAYSVSKRLRELGIRIALGAQRREVLQAALGRAVKLLAFGSAAGLLLGILASRVLAFIVYQATPRDPLVLAGVVFAMALLGLVATWIPAQRALSVNPLILLREE
ncbi:MAG TPA: ABC transporter permease [Terracidiphilus sp.]|jgi:predicted permease|nr:ABC transporter permease [Terracidiphilus sp.]